MISSLSLFLLLNFAYDIGLMTFKDGDSYEGMFVDDKYHGKGVLKFSNGTR